MDEEVFLLHLRGMKLLWLPSDVVTMEIIQPLKCEVPPL